MSALRSRLASLRAGASAPVRPPLAAPPGPGGREAPGELLETGAGPVRCVSRRYEPGFVHGARRLDDLLRRWSSERARELGGFAEPPAGAPELLFVDAETTGLGLGAGNRAFQLGFVRLHADGAVELEQLWLERAGQEPALVAAAVERLASAGAWVSFNGKCFDLPLLESRAVLAGRPWPQRPHLDLLHPARRLLARGLPNARLGSVEREVLGFERVDDLESAEAPAAWFAWLRDGQREPLEAVLQHNAWDLLSLVTLLAALLELVDGGDAPARLHHDPLALAEHQLRAGRPDEARRALAGGGQEPDLRRGLRHARLLKRLQGPGAAAESWRRLLADEAAGPEPFEELAKLLEHRERDPAAAREVVRAALARHGRRRRVRERLEHRLARLERKCREDSFPRLGPWE